MVEQELTVEGMSCGGCEDNVESEVSALDGVESVDADNETGRVAIEGDADDNELREAVERAGFTVSA
jgi:copper chaperone